MPRHRSLNLKRFVDSIPQDLMGRYLVIAFGRINTLPSLDSESIVDFLDKRADPDLRNRIYEDFTHINDLGEKVMNILVKAVNKYGIETSGEETKQELAMHLFLNHREAFDYAYDHYCLFNSSSKISYHKVPPCALSMTENKMKRFKQKIVEFYSNLAKGRECLVRHYDEGDQIVIVVIHGSYRRSVSAWEKGNLNTLFYRPAKEDILQFDIKTSVLSIQAPYQKDKLNYIKAFTHTILEKEDDIDESERDATYSLAPIQDGTFNFGGNETVTSVKLLEVKMSLRGSTNPDVMIRSSDVLETFRNDVLGININSGDLVHAKFRFGLEVDGRFRKVTFEITPPNITNLTTKRYANIISAYLEENGVKLI